MDWEKSFRKYVWDDQKTPYFTPVGRLTRYQANYEVYIYCLFVGILFAVAAVVSITGAGYAGRTPGAGIYAFSIVCATILLGTSKHVYAALYCASAPLGVVLYLLAYGFHPNLGLIDEVLVFVVVALWARYSLRVIAISRAYADMLAGGPGAGTGPGGA